MFFDHKITQTLFHCCGFCTEIMIAHLLWSLNLVWKLSELLVHYLATWWL